MTSFWLRCDGGIFQSGPAFSNSMEDMKEFDVRKASLPAFHHA